MCLCAWIWRLSSTNRSAAKIAGKKCYEHAWKLGSYVVVVIISKGHPLLFVLYNKNSKKNLGATENKNQLKLSVGRCCFYYYFAILTRWSESPSSQFFFSDVCGLPWPGAMVIELLPRWLKRPLPLSLSFSLVPQPSQQVYKRVGRCTVAPTPTLSDYHLFSFFVFLLFFHFWKFEFFRLFFPISPLLLLFSITGFSFGNEEIYWQKFLLFISPKK